MAGRRVQSRGLGVSAVGISRRRPQQEFSCQSRAGTGTAPGRAAGGDGVRGAREAGMGQGSGQPRGVRAVSGASHAHPCKALSVGEHRGGQSPSAPARQHGGGLGTVRSWHHCCDGCNAVEMCQVLSTSRDFPRDKSRQERERVAAPCPRLPQPSPSASLGSHSPSSLHAS